MVSAVYRCKGPNPNGSCQNGNNNPKYYNCPECGDGNKDNCDYLVCCDYPGTVYQSTTMPNYVHNLNGIETVTVAQTANFFTFINAS